MARKSKKELSKFYWLLGLTIADLLIPDPLPAVDEILLVGWTAWVGSKVL